MQDRYVGDVGDFVKYGLLRKLSGGLKLGVAWYLFPDERHNDDGKHDFYLKPKSTWRHLDPKLFDAMRAIRDEHGGVSEVEASGLLGDATFASERLDRLEVPVRGRSRWRNEWFTRVLREVDGCDIVFADPDNGLCPDERFSPGRYKDWKRLPTSEVNALAGGRCAVLYHHNTRRKGGHEAEIKHWLRTLDGAVIAVRARAGSSRTFFVVNPSATMEDRVRQFALDWASAGVELHELGTA